MSENELKKMKSKTIYLAEVDGIQLEVYKTNSSKIVNYNNQKEYDSKDVKIIKKLENQ